MKSLVGFSRHIHYRAAGPRGEAGAYGGNAGQTTIDLRRRARVRALRAVAEDLGYAVRVTTDGQQFIEAYGSFEPTTIVLDMIMPGMDGNELVLWLAQQKCTARVIIITGYTPDYATHAKTLAEFKGLGPVTTLHKPIEISRLRAVLGPHEAS